MKINFNAIMLYFFRPFCNRVIDFKYFSEILGGFLTFLKNFEIQDGGYRMAAVLTS